GLEVMEDQRSENEVRWTIIGDGKRIGGASTHGRYAVRFAKFAEILDSNLAPIEACDASSPAGGKQAGRAISAAHIDDMLAFQRTEIFVSRVKRRSQIAAQVSAATGGFRPAEQLIPKLVRM